MCFDARDVAANSSKWFESFDEKSMTIRVGFACDCDDESWEDLKKNLSEGAFSLIEEDGCVTLPFKYVVCPLCRGKGKHVNPSIDAHGITAEEWDRDWSYEDREMYMNGYYDVSCYQCHGKNVVPEIDDTYFGNPEREILKIIEDAIADEASYNRMCMTERAMGA